MRKLSALVLGAALAMATVPALAQTSNTQPGQTSTMPNASATPPGTANSGASSSTTRSNDEAPPAGSGTRALTPGQNADGTPTNQAPGGQPQLPGMKGQGK